MSQLRVLPRIFFVRVVKLIICMPPPSPTSDGLMRLPGPLKVIFNILAAILCSTHEITGGGDDR